MRIAPRRSFAALRMTEKKGAPSSSVILSEASTASEVEAALRRPEPCEGATAAPRPFTLFRAATKGPSRTASRQRSRYRIL
jgi:hypothetical protein